MAEVARRGIRGRAATRKRDPRRDQSRTCRRPHDADRRRARDRAVPADDGRLRCSRAVRIEAADFDIAAEIAALTAGRTDIGAVVTFTGLCRDEDGTLAALELEHYPGMARGRDHAHRRRGGAALAAAGPHGHPPLRQDRARRQHRAGRRGLAHRAGGLRGGEFPDGLPEDARALLEEGTPAPRRRRRVGRCARCRRCGFEALGRVRRGPSRPGPAGSSR